MAALFGLAGSTVGKIVVETCQAISRHLFSQYIKVPQQSEEIVDIFERRWGFPQAVGAIDGSHIPIEWLMENASDYYNCKGHFSIIVQGVVDCHG